MDLSAWSLVSSLTVDQAAHLWAGVDPAKASYMLTEDERTRIAPRKQMLVAAIMTNELPAETKHNGMRILGNHDSSLVARSDLEKFARTKKDFPAFLFDTLLPVSADPDVVETEASRPRNKGGRPQEHDWDAITIEVIRIANGPDGLPDTQAELIRDILEWYLDKYGKEPTESTLKARISTIYNALGLGRKPIDA